MHNGNNNKSLSNDLALINLSHIKLICNTDTRSFAEDRLDIDSGKVQKKLLNKSFKH